MHEAYQVHPLVKLSFQIEAIAAFNDNILVGTRQGHLFMYSLVKNDDKYEVQLMRYNKSFSKKAIQQLEVIPDYHLLISLTDNQVQVHDINALNFPTVHSMPPTKGATLFALNIQTQTSLTGERSVLVRMAVVVKRRLQLYFWQKKKTEFCKLMDEIALPDIPRSMVWCDEAICVGYRGEYALIKLGGDNVDLFPTSSSRSSEPCIVRVSDKTFALCRESQTVLVNTGGQTEQTKALKWSDVPVTMGWDEPYALGVLAECIEVQTLEPCGLVQTLSDLSKVRFIITCHQGLLYAASLSQVWCISAVDVARQRKVLLESQQFQLALKLTLISNENEDDKRERIHQIQTLLAYDLFTNRKFHESMTEFLKLGTDPYDVIRLFPDLLPQEAAAAASPAAVEGVTAKDLTEKELETGLLALIDYLTEMRRRPQADSQQQANINASGNLNADKTMAKSTQQLLQIIDTTLLKCYLHTNDALVAPLLRLNHCHLGEAEKILKKMGKLNDLIILYQTKGQHRRALELLRAEAQAERTVTYLQHLGADNMGLILEFADWVLTAVPEEGLKIFTEDLTEVERLHRPRVLDFLLRSHGSLVVPYLEHVVRSWNDTNPLFHNALVHQYRERIAEEGAGSAGGKRHRRRLLEFLHTSQHYTADTVLGHFPLDDLLEERAVVLGRLGRHDQALEIYVRALGDVEKAVGYCEKVWEGDGVGSQSVFVTLVKLVLDPTICSRSLPDLPLSPKTAQPDLEQALELLQAHASKVDPLEALAVLPDDVPVSRVQHFLSVALQKAVGERRRVQLLKGLLYAEHLQCQETRLRLQSQKVLVTELNVCLVCKKRFGNQSALVRYPNGDVVHYSCQEKK